MLVPCQYKLLELTNARYLLSQFCLGQAMLNFCFVYMSFDRKILLQNLATFHILFQVQITKVRVSYGPLTYCSDILKRLLRSFHVCFAGLYIVL